MTANSTQDYGSARFRYSTRWCRRYHGGASSAVGSGKGICECCLQPNVFALIYYSSIEWHMRLLLALDASTWALLTVNAIERFMLCPLRKLGIYCRIHCFRTLPFLCEAQVF